MRNRYTLAAGATLLTVLSIAGDAAAATVDYPGEYLVYTNADGRIFFNSSSLYLYYATGTPNGYLDTDIDSSGNLSFDSPAANFTTNSIGTTGYTGLLVVSNESGTVSFKGSGALSITLTAQIRFTGNGVTSPCHTPNFNVTISTSNSAGNWVPAGVSYDQSTGTFRATNANFTVPAIATDGTECGSAANASAINNALSLGGSARDEMVWYGYFTSSSTSYPTCGPSYFPCGT
jgi:hypothetical protein